MSPTERTLSYLKREYPMVGIVERFIHNKKIPSGIRSDLFHLFDIVVLSHNTIIGVQSCGTDFAAHFRKITEQYAKNAGMWLSCGGKIKLIGWRKVKAKRGGTRLVYKPRIADITEKDLKKSPWIKAQ